jgi:hypothetical protein
MGVDYDGVGGVGFKLDAVDVQTLIASGLFTQEAWEEDKDECLDKLELRKHGGTRQHIGDCYTGDGVGYAMLVKGKTLKEINDNAPAFCARLSEYGVMKTPDDLEIISELYIS